VSSTIARARPLSAAFIFSVAAALAAGAWLAGRLRLYAPGSDLGYLLGLAGSLMMALLLAYPLRKRLRWLRTAGDLRWWFRAHMFLGIAGPALVMFHSTLQVGSLNAAVALYSMLLVAGSGVVGRFIYTKIHHGLYGREATLEERRERLRAASDALTAQLREAPRLARRLGEFADYAGDQRRRGLLGARRFLAISLRSRWLRWTSRRLPARGLLEDYLDALQDVAQFRFYERLFSLWHVLHVPLVYMLVICAAFHVLAVHMY
jgi:hypothetical protein